MVISAHFLTGAAIGRITGNLVLAVVFGFVFHLTMDLVPHWNYGYKHLKKVKTLLLVLADPFLAFVIFLAIGLVHGYNLHAWIIAFLGGVACILPDLIEFTIRILKVRFLTPFLYFHRFIHWFDKHPKNIWETAEDEFPYTKKGIVYGILYQIPFLLISVYILIR